MYVYDGVNTKDTVKENVTMNEGISVKFEYKMDEVKQDD